MATVKEILSNFQILDAHVCTPDLNRNNITADLPAVQGNK